MLQLRGRLGPTRATRARTTLGLAERGVDQGTGYTLVRAWRASLLRKRRAGRGKFHARLHWVDRRGSVRLHYAGDFAEHLGKRVYPPWDVVKAVFKKAEFNFLFAYAIPGALMIHIANKLKIFVYDTDRELTWKRLIKETLAISVVADLLFYAVHRVVHLDGVRCSLRVALLVRGATPIARN